MDIILLKQIISYKFVCIISKSLQIVFLAKRFYSLRNSQNKLNLKWLAKKILVTKWTPLPFILPTIVTLRNVCHSTILSASQNVYLPFL